jgi:DNA-binding NarL/FixJ family response regulator
VTTPPCRLLIADEQPLLIWALEHTLAGVAGIVTATSREETCARLRDERLSGAIIACRLRDDDMSDVIVEFARLRPDVRLVALCRSGCAEQLQARLWRGRVLDSPFDVEEIVLALGLQIAHGLAALR